MPVTYDVLLRPDATPSQLKTVGAALWRWCIRTAGEGSIYRYLDNQALADLMSGRDPTPIEPASRRGSHFRARDELSPDRQTAVVGLRSEMPEEGILDVLVDGTSWHYPHESVSQDRSNDLEATTIRGHR